MRLFVPFSHDTLHVGAQKQVLHADLYLFDVLYLDDMADVGGGKPVNLPDLFHGVITFVVHKVGPAEFVQMGLGVIGAAVFSFGRYPVPVGICPECGRLHAELLFRFFSQEPVGDTFHINSHTEELVNMLLAVIVLSSDAADGNAIAFGGGIEP